MTIGELLAGADIAPADARALLAHVLDVSVTWIYAHESDPPQADTADRFDALVERCRGGEPLAYVLGYRDFWTLRLQVGPAALIPRRETEHLVEWALERADAGAEDLLDLGTGTGAIALACKSARPSLRVTASDVSGDALALAQANGRALALEVNWCQSDWFSGLGDQSWPLVVSNPPYIAEQDPHLREGDLPAEPHLALVSGPDGLTALSQIIDAAPHHLRSEGWLLLEHGFDQAERVRALLSQRGFVSVATRRDWSGHERVTGGMWCH